MVKLLIYQYTDTDILTDYRILTDAGSDNDYANTDIRNIRTDISVSVFTDYTDKSDYRSSPSGLTYKT